MVNPVSPPTTIGHPPVVELPAKDMAAHGLAHVELKNGCCEEPCHIEYDNIELVNTIRRHFLLNFGHRKLGDMVDDYADEAVMFNVVNGKSKRFEGLEEIRGAFEKIFAHHPEGESTFHLKSVIVNKNHGMAVWQATTPTSVFPNSCDTFVFDENGKIRTQFFNCQIIKPADDDNNKA